jgi:hypothetical protein
MWYNDFISRPAPRQSGGKGGKGGGKGGGGSSKSGSAGSFLYSANAIMGLCEGPGSVIDVWVQGTQQAENTLNVDSLASLNMGYFPGDYAQTPWSVVTSLHPTQALAYRGIMYVVGNNLDLGTSAVLPNWTFEVNALLSGSAIDGISVPPNVIMFDILTSPTHGIGFPPAFLADWTPYAVMTAGAHMWCSDTISTRTPANTYFQTLIEATNSEFVWSGGILNIVPYGDCGVVSSGVGTYTPPSTPIYSFTDDDFMENQGAISSGSHITVDPVIITRKARSSVLNDIIIEYLDRSNFYNPAVAEVMDDSEITQFGFRPSDTKQYHFFQDAQSANVSAQLLLRRQQVANLYSITVDERYILLDPMDLIELTDTNLGLLNTPVLVKEITENPDGSLNMLCEDYLNDASTIPVYFVQPSSGFNLNFNAMAPNVNDVTIFEPTHVMARTPEIWITVNGPTDWGGCTVWVSNDGNSYIEGPNIQGGARMGISPSGLPVFTPTTAGPIIDNTNTLGVDISSHPADNQLISGSLLDLQNGNTACYLDGEFIAYQTATLISTGVYNLTGLQRGLYKSPVSLHNPNTKFVRLDGNGLMRVPYTPDRIGQTVWLKFLSVNQFGGGKQQLSDVIPYRYSITGSSFMNPPDDVTNVTTMFIGNLTEIDWIPPADDRPVYYEIRKGPSWIGGQVVKQQLVPRIQVQGDDNYWIGVYVLSPGGVKIYSVNPPEVIVAGGTIVDNVVVTWDEAALGWPGTLSSGLSIVGSDIITDVGTLTPEVYGVPTSHYIDLGYIAPCNINITWQGQGLNATQDILSVVDWLGYSDVLSYLSTAATTIYPMVAVGDSVLMGSYRRFQAGVYVGQRFQFLMIMQSSDVQVQAVLLQFKISVDVPDRIDHFNNQSITSAAGGQTLLFRPDGKATAPFNGGAAGSSIPLWRASIINATSGDIVVVTSLNLSSCIVRVFNGGTQVARNINIEFQGY